MGVQFARSQTRKIFSDNTTASAILSRIIGSLIAMALLLWTIRYGYEAATEPRKHQLYGRWLSCIGALIMLFGLLLVVLGLPIMADLFLRLSEELRCPEDTGIHQASNLKVDISV